MYSQQTSFFAINLPVENPILYTVSPYHDGYLLKPISKREILKTNIGNNKDLLAPLGTIPFELEGEFETNLIIAKQRLLKRKKTICISMIPSPSYGYNLNIMPPTLILDTMKGNNSFLIKKNIKFTIPFEKDKHQYSPNDIQPLINSLELNKFNISEIKIYTYASVEGDKERNYRLQQKRAESILKAFQSFQFDTIKTTVRTSENWRSFKKEIKGTKYKRLLHLNKIEIKEELKKDRVIQDLEPLLSKHRKAVIYIKSIERISHTSTPLELLNEYRTLLKDSNSSLESISFAQKQLFVDILQKKLDIKELINIHIPEKAEFIKLINNQIAIEYLLDQQIPPITKLKLYDSLAIKQPRILYNIYGFMIQHWYDNPAFDADHMNLLKGIKRVYSTKAITSGEHFKMMLNYHIAAANHYRTIRALKKEKKIDSICTSVLFESKA